MRIATGCLTAFAVLGFVIILSGLTLELYVYERYEAAIRDFPAVINGWWLVGIGTVFAAVFAVARFDPRSILTIDSSGIRAPRHGVETPIGHIRSIRLLKDEEERLAFIAVDVTNPGIIRGADKPKNRYKLEALHLDANTIPFSLAFLVFDEQELVAAIDELNAMIERTHVNDT
ncbi:hypothetical protein [Aeoliella sp.]|uniref:hypothetical protein n=1 Tax=Aeoliella sp. TaxID=2795800 RepID=UPI003CCC0F2D